MSEAHAHLQAWSLPLGITCGLVLVALVYLRGWLRLRSVFPNVILGWQVAAFMSGLSFLWIGVSSPLSALDHDLLTIHMINHLVLMVVGPPLMLAGVPGLLLLLGLPAKLGHAVHDLFFGNPPAQRLLRLVTHPAFGWLCATATVIGWHIPAVFQLAMRSHWWHELEYACFTTAGFLFWWPVVHPMPSVPQWPRWSMPVYLFLATLPCDILSAFLAFCGRVVYPSYLSAPRLFNLSPLQDQQCAGALMWVAVTFAYLVPAVVITVQMLSPVRSHSQQPARSALRDVALSSLNGSRAEVV
jgi:putative membrane protein